MRHIGDNYHEFTCRCGEAVLLRGGDHAHHGSDGPLCGKCGKGMPLRRVGHKSTEVICEVCRARLSEEIIGGMFPTVHDDGEITTICGECQRLDPEGEEWKDRT